MGSFTVEMAAGLPGPAWLRARRTAAAERFAGQSLPTTEDELWRYTPIGSLNLDDYHLVDSGVPQDPGAGVFADAVTPRAGLVLVVDGRLQSVELADGVREQGVTVEAAGDDTPPPRLLDLPDADALGALHDAFVADLVVVRVPAGVAVENPIVVVQVSTDAGAATFPHLVVEVGDQAKVTVLDHWTSSDARAFISPVTEIQSGAGANVRYVGVQDFGPEVWSTGHLLVSPGRDATTNVWLATLGGHYARLYVDADLGDQAASADIAGVYVGDRGQTLDVRSLQDHRATRTVSNLLLKGAVLDKAHAIYTGLIRVREGAKATESFLANRNLVLADGAHVDSVPNLEIVNENDIKSCGHAAATGPVDEEHVFYLESRGVPTDVAERLIVFGFFDDVVSKIPVAGLHQPLRAAIAAKLDKAGSGA